MIEHTAMLRQCGGALRSWADILRSVAESRDLTHTEKAILSSATQLSGDVDRVLQGEQPVDGDNQQAVYVEHLIRQSRAA